MNVLYYALGGGHGHAVRGMAVLDRLGHGTLVCPARLIPWAESLGIPTLAPPDDPDSLRHWFQALPAPDLLLVDVFPRGVVGDLVGLLGRCPALLISRWVHPSYYLHEHVRAALESCYEKLVWCEEPAPSLRSVGVSQSVVEPVLLGVPPLPRPEARQALGVSESVSLILALGAGVPDLQARLHRLLRKIAARLRAEMRFVTDALPVGLGVTRLFPAARYLRAADVIVAAGGYHAFHESRAAGVPTVYLPQSRRYDDQARRVGGETVATDPVDLERAVRAALQARGAGVREAPTAADGAAEIATLVEARLRSSAA